MVNTFPNFHDQALIKIIFEHHTPFRQCGSSSDYGSIHSSIHLVMTCEVELIQINFFVMLHNGPYMSLSPPHALDARTTAQLDKRRVAVPADMSLSDTQVHNTCSKQA